MRLYLAVALVTSAIASVATIHYLAGHGKGPPPEGGGPCTHSFRRGFGSDQPQLAHQPPSASG
jgi:hypothetical protein